MKYQVRLYWNTRPVLDGQSSATIAFNVIRHLMVDNFVGDTAKEGDKQCPTLRDLTNLPVGQRFAGQVGDDTGTASYWLKRIE